MPVASYPIERFNAGILSGTARGRIDIEDYRAGARVLDNFLAIVEGAITKRSGLRYVKAVKDSSKTTRLFDFEFNVEQTYMLEFGDLYFRVMRDEGAVVDTAQAFTASPTAANPVVVTITGHPFSDGDEVFIAGSSMLQLNGRFFTVANAGVNDFELSGEDGTGRSTGTGGTAAKSIEVVTTYAHGDLPKVKTIQSADILYMFHTQYAYRKVTRSSDTAWSIAAVTYDDLIWPAFEADNLSAVTITPGATTGTSQTLTASSAIFVASDVGRYIRVTQGDEDDEGYCLVTAVASPPSTTCTVDIIKDFLNVSAATRWARDAWNPVNGYPTCAVFHEDRLWLGGVPGLPQSVWASKIADYDNHRRATTAVGALLLPLNSESINPIEWVISGDGLAIGTRGSEWTITAIDSDSAISAGNVRARKRGSRGSRAGVEVLAIDNAVLFVQRAGKKLREFIYQFVQDSYSTVNLNRLTRDITQGIIRYLAYQQEPHQTVWANMEDGTQAALTYEREDQVAAWSNFVSGGTAPTLQSVASIPSASETSDQTWFIVQRTVDGSVVQYIEVLQPFWEQGGDIRDAFFVDAGITWDGGAELPGTTGNLFTGSVIVGSYVLTDSAHGLAVGDFVRFEASAFSNLLGNVYEVVSVPAADLIHFAPVGGAAYTTDMNGTHAVTIEKVAKTFYGLNHLEGEMLSVLADGAVITGVMVSGGTVVLTEYANTVHFGLGYSSDYLSMPIEAGSADGTAQGKTGRIHEAVFRLYQTGEGAKFGPELDDDRLASLVTRQVSDPMDAPVPLYDGDTEPQAFPSGYGEDKALAFRHDTPLPCTLVAAWLKMRTNG